MLNRTIIMFLPIALIILSGCASKNSSEPKISPKPVKNEKIEISVDITNDLTQFDKELIEIAKQSEIKYNEYIELLKLMKKEKKLKTSKIPRNMGKRLTFSFDGYALLLVKKVAAEAGYTIELENIRIADSKIISRDYHNTMIVDILRDISDDMGFNIEIDEKNMSIKVSLE